MPDEGARKMQVSRVLRSKEEARASYNALSRWYDLLVSSERKLADLGLSTLAPTAGEHILEIGYGTGYALLQPANAVGPGGKVYGLDISDGMRAVAEKRIEHAGLSSRVELKTGDACRLPLDSDSMQAIFTSFTLELFDTPQIPLVLHECGRVLLPKGRICIVCMAVDQRPGWALRAYQWMHEQLPKAVDCRPILLVQSLEEAGFRIASVTRRKTWGLPVGICLATYSDMC